jgi:Mrp family chromosome partitioning ATPase
MLLTYVQNFSSIGVDSSINRRGSKIHVIEMFEQNALSDVKHVIGVMSGKGGVGKSSVTALAAVALARRGHTVGIMDADITGPSIPKMFGVHGRLDASETGIFPAQTGRLGIRIVSLNLMLEREDEPVVWRGPLLMGMIRRFWSEVNWGDIDYMLIDLPPGTGDVPLSVMQSVPLDGLIAVSSPQDVAALIVRKAINMTRLMQKRVIGLVENMSYITCPHCGEAVYPFGRPSGEEQAAGLGVPFIGEMPIDPELSAMADRGEVELYEHPIMESLADVVSRAAKGEGAWSEPGAEARAAADTNRENR